MPWLSRRRRVARRQTVDADTMQTVSLRQDSARRTLVAMAASGQLALPAVPSIVRRVIERLRDDELSISQLVDDVEQEPYIAACVLRMANSPYFGCRGTVGSIGDAVSLVGLRALKTLVISGGLRAAFVSVPGIDLRDFWWDAQVTASLARALAVPFRADAESAYLTGLIGRTGQLIIAQAFGAQMSSVLDQVRPPRAAALAHAENEACGMSHPEVGAAWMDMLGFPQALCRAVACQLELPEDGEALDSVLWIVTQTTEVLRRSATFAGAWPHLAAALDGLPWHALHGSTPEAIRQALESVHERAAAAGDHR